MSRANRSLFADTDETARDAGERLLLGAATDAPTDERPRTDEQTNHWYRWRLAAENLIRPLSLDTVAEMIRERAVLVRWARGCAETLVLAFHLPVSGWHRTMIAAGKSGRRVAPLLAWRSRAVSG